MKLDHIEISSLKLSVLNVRKHGQRKGTDLVSSIRSLGVLQPLLVRPNCEGYEIVAGQRRFDACQSLIRDGFEIGPLPCIIMDESDDATAIEASLAENIARLPMDEIDQYEAFAALVEQGQSAQDIAKEFGVTEKLVHQRLAIANLYSPILNAYRRNEVDAPTLRNLTMATARQQKAWWKLFKDEDQWAPLGRQLKDWLFGGQQIPISNALFDVEDYSGSITSDLFGEDRYFTDAAQFWEFQSKAVAQAKERYIEDGWLEVIVMETGRFWQAWDYQETSMEDGGKVFITCTHDGEISFHEGFLSTKEARRRQQAQAGEQMEATIRPEVTKAMQNYLELHRHNAVRVELLKSPDLALRLMLAHAIAGSSLWHVDGERQRAINADIEHSIAASKAQAAFNEEAAAIRDLLGISHGRDVVDHGWQCRSLAEIFTHLRELDDQSVMRILAFVMAETLQSGTGFIEWLGKMLNVNMADWWTPEDTFFDLLRDKTVINEMVREMAGREAANANVTATAKVQKAIISDCLEGTRKPATKDWLPRYMQLPMKTYTDRGGIAVLEEFQTISAENVEHAKAG